MIRKAYPIASFKTYDDQPGKFQAIVSVFHNVDLQGDRVLPGAFSKTLKRWREKGDPIPVIWSHDWLNPDAHIGFVDPAEATETDKGLLVTGKMDIHKPFAAQVHDLLKERRVKEWSFAYDVDEEQVNEKDGANELKSLSIIEVGPCLKGANPDTYTVSAKSAAEAELNEAWEATRSLTKFIELIKTVEQPDIARMLTKSYIEPSQTRTKRYHVESAGSVFACVDNETGVEVDEHKTADEASSHVHELEKIQIAKGTPSMSENEIRAALDLPPREEEKAEVDNLDDIVAAISASEEKSVDPTVTVLIDGYKFQVNPEELALVEDDDEEEKARGPQEEATEKVAGKPWHVSKQGDQFCCILDSDGSTVDCHDSQEDAEAHVRALYANASNDDPEGDKALVAPEAAPYITVDEARANLGLAPKSDSVLEEGEVVTEPDRTDHVHTINTSSDSAHSISFTTDTTSTTNGSQPWTNSNVSLQDMIAAAVEKAMEDRFGKKSEEEESESPTEWLERMLEGDK